MHSKKKLAYKSKNQLDFFVNNCNTYCSFYNNHAYAILEFLIRALVEMAKCFGSFHISLIPN